MNLEQIALKLISGDINLVEWELEMREFIRTTHRTAVIAAMDGVENVTQAAWGFEGSLVKKQFQYLNGFVQDIRSNPSAWMNGRLLTRMRLYEQAGWGSFEEIIRWKMKREGFTEEMRDLGEADHCEGCIKQAGLGWRPIGTLPPIGSQECVTNCRCVFWYRKQLPDGGYVYDKGN